MTPAFDQSTFLAARSEWAQQIIDNPPVRVALPGAKAPIATDRLIALQELGVTNGEIVERINRTHARDS